MGCIFPFVLPLTPGPRSRGESAPLEESYTYLKLKINNRFTDRDFDKENPAIFKDD